MKQQPIQLSVITATRNRPAQLAHCLHQFHRQSPGNLNCEQIIVSDGKDPTAKLLAKHWGARFFELPEPRGHAGAFAKDFGIQQARGEFVCFWDDDNIYEPHALATLFATALGNDIGVVRTRHRLRVRNQLTTLPRHWSGAFRPGDVDTMCVAVKRELALKESWGDDHPPPGTDFRWLQKLEAHQPRIRYVPVRIGYHL